jgi:hypothetical protein
MTTALKNEIKRLARESVREALEEEVLRFNASRLPLVSEKEQKQIEKLYKRPFHQSVATPAEIAAIERGRREHARGAYVVFNHTIHGMDSNARSQRRQKSRKSSR